MKNIDILKSSLVSVIIPTYNRSLELKRAITSVLNQVYYNFEILVVDDGSEEDLKIVCDSFKDSRIHFLRNEKHTNANVARNRGIKESKGEYIAMLDSDDEFLPHHLERRMIKIKEWDCDGIFGSAVMCNGKTKHIKLSRQINTNESMINYLLSDGFAPTPSHFYKKNAAKDIMWNERLSRHQDFDFSSRFYEKYSFMADYEPSIIVNYQEKGLPLINFDDCQYFIESIKDRIEKTNYKNYCLKMLVHAKYLSNKPAINYYKYEMNKNIFAISYSEFKQFNTSANRLLSMLAPLYYTFKLFVNILSKNK